MLCYAIAAEQSKADVGISSAPPAERSVTSAEVSCMQVYANDLNPRSHHYLEINIKLNRVCSCLFHVSNKLCNALDNVSPRPLKDESRSPYNFSDICSALSCAMRWH